MGDTGEKILNSNITADIAKEKFLAGESPYLLTGPWNVPDIEKAGINVRHRSASHRGIRTGPAVHRRQRLLHQLPRASNALAANEFVVNYLTRKLCRTRCSGRRPPAGVEGVLREGSKRPGCGSLRQDRRQRRADAGRSGDGRRLGRLGRHRTGPDQGHRATRRLRGRPWPPTSKRRSPEVSLPRLSPRPACLSRPAGRPITICLPPLKARSSNRLHIDTAASPAYATDQSKEAQARPGFTGRHPRQDRAARSVDAFAVYVLIVLFIERELDRARCRRPRHGPDQLDLPAQGRSSRQVPGSGRLFPADLPDLRVFVHAATSPSPTTATGTTAPRKMRSPPSNARPSKARPGLACLPGLRARPRATTSTCSSPTPTARPCSAAPDRPLEKVADVQRDGSTGKANRHGWLHARLNFQRDRRQPGRDHWP